MAYDDSEERDNHGRWSGGGGGPHRSGIRVPSTTLCNVTPHTAAQWLGTMPRNRMIRPRLVRELAAAIREGRWDARTTIDFDEDGRLRNGQHRLAAVIVTGQTVTMRVRRGVPRANYFPARREGILRRWRRWDRISRITSDEVRRRSGRVPVRSSGAGEAQP